MLDWVIEGATVVDGTDAPPFTADVGVRNGRIAEIGRITGAARERISGHGAWLTPGFVDIHTHYDGQATWDETFSPSIHHGVTTLLMGNCGVGFAPNVPGREAELIALMEGVEDIPGAALAEGVKFNWRSFGDYLDVLQAMPHSLDFLALVPHDPLRMAVMGERALAQEAATPADIAAMQGLLREALQGGAAGFSTGRTDNHRTARGQETPASEASAAELAGLGAAFQGLDRGVVQMVSDFNLLHGPDQFDTEFDLVEGLARASGRPLSLSWMQRDPGGEQWKAMQARVETAVAQGLPLYLQAASRGIGVINGLDASFHPFMGFPGYKEIAQLPLPARAAALRDPARKARILGQMSERISGDGSAVPPLVDILLSRIELVSGRMFPLASAEGLTPDYEPNVMTSFLARARQRGCTALEALYDHFAEGDGGNLVYFPLFNYNGGNLDVVRQNAIPQPGQKPPDGVALCLGTMMFGDQTDQAEAAASWPMPMRGRELHRHRRRLHRGARRDGGQADQAAPARLGAGHQARQCDVEAAQRGPLFAQLDAARRRRQPAPAADRPHRHPVPAPRLPGMDLEEPCVRWPTCCAPARSATGACPTSAAGALPRWCTARGS
jgi:N-acyl-D-aspartate/D-glutamate deacylase